MRILRFIGIILLAKAVSCLHAKFSFEIQCSWFEMQGAAGGGLSAIRKGTELKIFFILNKLTEKVKTRSAQTVDFSSLNSGMIKNIFLTFRAYAPVRQPPARRSLSPRFSSIFSLLNIRKSSLHEITLLQGTSHFI